MVIEESVSTVAEAAIAPAMIWLCTNKTLHARVDQPGAELRQIDDADGQREQSEDIERDDAAGDARRALRGEELECAPQPTADPAQPAPAHTRQRFAVTVGLAMSLGFGWCVGLIGRRGFC